MTIQQALISQRLTDALRAPLPRLTPRDVVLPGLRGKALAVVGVRRAGKTSFLWQCLADRLATGRPRESVVLIGLEDDRLIGMDVTDLDWLVEEYFRRHPAFRATGPVTLCFDEIQVIPHWERFVRRLIDTEPIEILLSGSSAKLLSREVATALRGRGAEVLVHPFSFREALRHAGHEPAGPWDQLDRVQRSDLANRLDHYLATGGFPEAQGLAAHDRIPLLRGYVDVVALRDVIERHGVSNSTALRWLQRQLLSTPAGAFSIQKLFQTLRSQGIPVGKDTLHEYLAHLEDTFLIRTVSIHTASARKRMVNPRKVYPVDPGLIAAYERTGRSQVGHALETVVMLELERRGYEIAYLRTPEWEVDFLATRPNGPPLLIQVCADVRDDDTLARELRGLEAAVIEHPGAAALLLTLQTQPPASALPRRIAWVPATQWLLERPSESPSGEVR